MRALVLGTLVLLSGCAAVTPSIAFNAAGASDPVRDRAVRKALEDALDSSEEMKGEADSIQIFAGTIPEGLVLKDAVMSVAEGYSHQIIGKISLRAPNGLVGFSDYRAGWKKPYCYPQVVIGMGIFTYYLPTYWPFCFADAQPDLEYWMKDIRSVAHKMGANMVVGSYLGMNKDGLSAAGFDGVLILADPRALGKKSEPVPTKI